MAMLVRKELLSPEWAERVLSWPHTGFNAHSLVRVKTKIEAERVGKYMLRPVLALERLAFLEPEGKVGYRFGFMSRRLESHLLMVTLSAVFFFRHPVRLLDTVLPMGVPR